MKNKEMEYEKEFNRLQGIYEKKFGDVYPTYPRYSWEDLCEKIRECIEKNSPLDLRPSCMY